MSCTFLLILRSRFSCLIFTPYNFIHNNHLFVLFNLIFYIQVLLLMLPHLLLLSHNILIRIGLFLSCIIPLPPQVFLVFQLPFQLVVILIHCHLTRLQLLLSLDASEATPFIWIILIIFLSTFNSRISTINESNKGIFLASRFLMHRVLAPP